MGVNRQNIKIADQGWEFNKQGVEISTSRTLKSQTEVEQMDNQIQLY